MKINKIPTLIILIVNFLLVGILSVNAQTGCCSSGIIPFTCFESGSNQDQCCPGESVNPGLYDPNLNPNGPSSQDDCVTNFFNSGESCQSVSRCELGCCCAASGSEKTAQAKCIGAGTQFQLGEGLDCNEVCSVTECNDGQDNDGDSCIDYLNDPGCSSSDDNSEGTAVGNCVILPGTCDDPGHTPKLSNLIISPVKGEKKFNLKWDDECIQNSASYEIKRCDKEKNCQDFKINTNGFEDNSEELLFDKEYTYQVTAIYKIQSAKPTLEGTGNLGNLECLGKSDSKLFCLHENSYDEYKDYLINNLGFKTETFIEDVIKKFGSSDKDRLNKAFFCNNINNLKLEGPDPACTDGEVCAIINGNSKCLEPSACIYDSATKYDIFSLPFGMYSTQNRCESKNGISNEPRYCFYDRSKTTADSCFACSPTMSCYDYKTQDTCIRDNCNVENCGWKKKTDLELGVCISLVSSNCEWCDKPGTKDMENLGAKNSVFSQCTQEKSDTLSVNKFLCSFNPDTKKSTDCNDIKCTDYDQSQCGSGPTLTQNNVINPSDGTDSCKIKVCEWFNTRCRKNADGDNQKDCGPGSPNSCKEHDFFPPQAALTKLINSRDVLERLLIEIKDKTSSRGPVAEKNNEEYKLFFCLSSDCTSKHPFPKSTTSDNLIVSNLGLFDGTNKIYNLNSGSNTIKYYAQDPSKNVGVVKEISFGALDGINGPIVAKFSVNNDPNTFNEEDTYYTRKIDSVTVTFVEPDIDITKAKIARITKGTNIISPLNINTILLNQEFEFNFNINDPGTYNFELDVKNFAGIPISEIFTKKIIVDSVSPEVIVKINSKEINEQVTEVFQDSILDLELQFNEEIIIQSLKINGDEINLSTEDRIKFTANINLTDGSKTLILTAVDLSGNLIEKIYNFDINALPLEITLLKPSFGVSKTEEFIFEVETENEADCRFSIQDKIAFGSMTVLFTQNGLIHSKQNLQLNDQQTETFWITCKDRVTEEFKSANFSIGVDSTPPNIEKLFMEPAFANHAPEKSKIRLVTDDKTRCKFSENINANFNEMIPFDNFQEGVFSKINNHEISVDSIGDYTFYIICQNRAEDLSSRQSTTFTVDPDVQLTINSVSMKEFYSTKSVDLIIETNLATQCRYTSPTDGIQTPVFFTSNSAIAHRITLTLLTEGAHNYNIECWDGKWIEGPEVSFKVDLSPPNMLFVTQESTLQNNPTLTCNNDRLRVKWLAEDIGSGVDFYTYSIIKINDTENEILVSNKRTRWYSDPENNEEWIWIPNPSISGLDVTLDLENGATYLFKTNATDFFLFNSTSLESEGIKVDTSFCRIAECGNGFIDPGEQCDNQKFGTINECSDLEFSGGTITCDSNCKLDTTGCTGTVGTCGDDIINKGETCDTDNLGIISDLRCISYTDDFISGNLRCDSCQIDTNNCNSNTTTLTCKDRGDCDEDKTCSDNSDCLSRFCFNDVCVEATCDDQTKNQDESDIDCGGSCDKCQIGNKCNVANDCNTNLCEFGKCIEGGKCSDNELSAGETDIDCGGICLTKCSEDNKCNQDTDCNEGLGCVNSICKKTLKDTDGDGIPDEWEIEHGLDPNDPDDASDDYDNDGLINLREYQLGTNPNKADTDGDGYDDNVELIKNTDPLDPNSKPKSKFGLILLILFIIILFSVGGYFGYDYYLREKERKIKPPSQVKRPVMPPPKTIKPIQKQVRKKDVGQLVKKKKEERRALRRKIFEKFGESEKDLKLRKLPVISIIKKPKEKSKKEIKVNKQGTNVQTTKKGDAIEKLREIGKKPKISADSKSVKSSKKQLIKPTKNNNKDAIQKLKDLGEKTKKKKTTKKDVFKELKSISKSKNKPKKK